MTIIAFLVLALLAMAQAAWATQHLVRPGDDWESLAAGLKPGDEIILMPGTHQPAQVSSLRGTKDRPIIIRGMDPKRPAVIAAESRGLELHRPQHVVIENLTITGATICGLSIDDELPRGAQPVDENGELFNAYVTIRNVTVTRTGPQGNRDAIQLTGLRNVRIENCTVQGWGDSGIELVGCRDVAIEQCLLEGLPGHTQVDGIRTDGGTERVVIRECHFNNAGVHGVSLGGDLPLKSFRPPVPPNATPGTVYRAKHVRVERCVFVGCRAAAALINSDGGELRYNTVIRPRGTAFRILYDNSDARLAPGRRGLFSGNLIVAAAGDLETRAWADPQLDVTSYIWEENLWWCPVTVISDGQPGSLPGHVQWDQITTVDPQLDDENRPQLAEAKAFGASAE